VVLADQVRSVDWRARRAERIGAAPAALISEVLGRFSTLLD
jgi:mRNA-degrading endonuclease toxin of MazEF toxin-antitoxin module